MGEPAAGALAAILKALADPLRVRMLSAISTDSRGEACVCDLEALADVSQPTISHHLKVMRDAGVLESERRGTWVYYRITPSLRPAVTMLLDSFAPTAVDADQPTDTRLADVDAELTRIAADMHDNHPALDPQLVVHVVRESYAGLARRTTVSRPLVPLTEKFARQRLDDLSRDTTTDAPHVLFVCVANAGRSQLAAALLTERSGGRVIARSAGSAPAGRVQPRVRALIEEIDPTSDPFPKPLTDDAVRAADVVITMGCGDVCPVIPGVRYEDWPVGDPALASPAGIEAIRDDIAARVETLLTTLGKRPS
ncbi:metalloregulator ArsR/SmtB family transcription factor [Microbacterium nymphoidis]|uniref:metalloregulator ArsR/SmtB family transcription factor n=1 Tax=Microbacterium nymphoidis TaxID=2898586 RepID=UPI001E356D04|nr:metalloregulator ArsR/SmtB family transcription factor [Microbacterium nymphoidis]MCD2498454.1 metalloregulator ArsR/SmtB family transcription factor [Microbacterium nymphoidis]